MQLYLLFADLTDRVVMVIVGGHMTAGEANMPSARSPGWN
jgi:hypothetical protein